MTQEGIVSKIGVNHCYVKINHEIYMTKIRNQINKTEKILVGDFVLVSQAEDEWIIEKVLPRKNQLYRPRIANVDQILLFMALVQPSFNFYLTNKMLLLFSFYQIPVNLVITKMDLKTITEDALLVKINYYKTWGYNIIFLSNEDPDSFVALKAVLSYKISVFTGVSGVGKSTSLNNLNPHFKVKTQDVSQVTKRGQHTTTTITLYPFLGGMIGDTPGFASFNITNLTKINVAQNFPGFKTYFQKCYFPNCLHLSEIKCAVKIAVQNQLFPEFQYKSYQKILTEIK